MTAVSKHGQETPSALPTLRDAPQVCAKRKRGGAPQGAALVSGTAAGRAACLAGRHRVDDHPPVAPS